MEKIILIKQLHLLLHLFLLSALFSGCIKEKLLSSQTETRVYFTPTGTINPAEIKTIRLYVFDKDGILQTMAESNDPHISANYYIALENLPPGSYRFVMWGGLYEDYTTQPALFTVGQTNFNEAVLLFGHENEAPVIQQHLFFAYLPDKRITGTKNQFISMPIVQNTNQINLTTEGLPINEDTYRFTITDNNGKYYFDNSFADDTDFNYTTFCSKNAQGQPTVTLKILKLDAAKRLMITIINETTQKTIYTADLVELLNTLGIDFMTHHEFNIHIKFNIDMTIDIFINNWRVIESSVVV